MKKIELGKLKPHIKLKKITLILLCVNAALALLSGICFAVCFSFPGRLQSQFAAERWTGESELRFEQLSCFMSERDTLGVGNIYEFRAKLTEKLTTASIEAPENGSLFSDAWSCSGKLAAYGDHGNAECSVIAAGGDYFAFHPLRLLSGSYISEDDLMGDRVLLDRELAWRLFGGTDLQGMTVTVNNLPYMVAGVVEREQDFASEKADGEVARMYMSYSAYNTVMGGEELSGEPIECYEIVMPQPVEGFAEDILKNDFPIGSGEIINNSGRFTFGEIFGIIKQFGTRSMHTTSVIYPYWENAARCLGDWCALFMLLGIIFGASPLACAFVALMILLIRLKDYLSDNVPEWTSNALDRVRQRRYGAAQKRKQKLLKGESRNVKGLLHKRTDSGGGSEDV
ncbi:MAG: ABC transporter permease [Butyricicoccus sp.]|nr:ABC transporter permease [Butyricicoccus sp.]